MRSECKHIKADNRCRTQYQYLCKELYHCGINSAEVQHSAKALCDKVGGQKFLKPKTYRPTGIALGAPLPTKSYATRIWRITQLLDGKIARMSNSKTPTLALVPKEWYHVTVVNRTHYEKNSNVSILSNEEKRKANKIINKLQADPLTIQFNGFLLTSNGRLIILGYPCDLRFYKIRYSLAKEVPQLRVNVPNTVHIKIGHLLVDLTDQQLLQVMGWLYRFSIHLHFVETFEKYYTPCGTIS